MDDKETPGDRHQTAEAGSLKMSAMIHLLIPVVLWGAANAAFAQDPYAQRWLELRRGIAAGRDVRELLRQWDAQDGVSRRTPQAERLRVRRSPSGNLDADREDVRVAACEAGVPPSLALAIVERESGFDNRAIGEKGELGAGQILPTTAVAFGFDRSRLAANREYNVRASVTIMRSLLDSFGRDEQAAIRGYNGGRGWQTAGPAAMQKVNTYAVAINRLRRKYAFVDCQ